MNILITGALGFFGLNLTYTLASHVDIRVIATDVRQPTPEQQRFLRPIAKQITFCSLNVQDRRAIHRLLKEQQISHIVHAAALTPTHSQEQRQPTQIVDINLVGTVNVLDAAIATPSIQRVIVASSSGVYGTSEKAMKTMQNEEGALVLDQLYSITKRSVELLTQRYCQLSGISMAAVRLGPLYGPLERPSPSRQHISTIGQLMDALLKNKAISVAGPLIRRDWMYMVDAGNAILALLQTAQLDYAVYNVGCGTSVPWRQVVDTFIAHGLSATWIDDEAKADIGMRPEQERLAMDIARLRGDTGFVPHYKINMGIASYLESEKRTIVDGK